MIDPNVSARLNCIRLVSRPLFANFILGVIILNAVVIGLETYPDFYKEHYFVLKCLDQLCLTIFIFEIGIKIIAAGSIRDFFQDRWDTFDFLIVASALLPFGISEVGIARVFRLLRVIRAVTYLKQLRLLVFTLLKTLPSLANIIVLMSLLFYVYATMGATLFGAVMPEEFGNLGKAALTLFGVVTLEGWVELMQTANEHFAYSWIYFVSFILLGTFIIINLFVAVVVSNLEDSFQEQEAAKLAADLNEAQLLAKLQRLVLEQSRKVEELSAFLATRKETEASQNEAPPPVRSRRSKKRKAHEEKNPKDKAA